MFTKCMHGYLARIALTKLENIASSSGTESSVLGPLAERVHPHFAILSTRTHSIVAEADASHRACVSRESPLHDH